MTQRETKTKMKAIFFLVTLLIVASVEGGKGGGEAMYSEEDGVVELNKENFAAQVFGTEHVWVVEFFAPWCGHCKALKPEYIKAAKSLRGIIRVGAVNCDEQKELCGAMEVKGFPTLKLFPSERTEKSVEGGKKRGFVKIPVEYDGPRTAASIATRATSMLPNFATVLADEEKADAWLAAPPALPKVILFTDKSSTPTLYKALSIDFHNAVEMAEVRKSQQSKSLLQRFSVTKFPTLLVIPKPGAEPIKYNGQIQHEPLFKFLFPFAKEAFEEHKKQAAGESEGETGKTHIPEDPREWELARITSAAEWEESCLRRKGVCAVAVLDPLNSPDDVPAHEGMLRELAARYKGKLHVMWLGAMEQPDFVKAFDLRSGFPALVAVNPARGPSGKTRFTRFVGAFAVDSISNFFDALLTGRKGAIEPEGPVVIHDVNPADFLPPKDVPEEEDVQKEL